MSACSAGVGNGIATAFNVPDEITGRPASPASIRIWRRTGDSAVRQYIKKAASAFLGSKRIRERFGEKEQCAVAKYEVVEFYPTYNYM